MDNFILSDWENYGRFKTIRQKKRLRIKDKDKQLIQLNKKLEELYAKLRTLPAVPLAEPYQRGWKRYFELRWDVAISREADFFHGLLDKINTVQYSHKRMFQTKKRCRGKKIYINKPQYLAMIYDWDWRKNNIKNWQGFDVRFSEKEKQYFSVKMMPMYNYDKLIPVYYCNEAWRFVLKVKPNIITHTKMRDNELLSQLNEINQYLIQHNLKHRMRKLVNGRKQNWYGRSTQLYQRKKPYVQDLLNEYYSDQYGN